jgi:hypothetical protein
MIVEHTIPEENDVAARGVQPSIDPVAAVDLVLLSDIAVGGDLGAL